jgi:hypothetical protein
MPKDQMPPMPMPAMPTTPVGIPPEFEAMKKKPHKRGMHSDKKYQSGTGRHANPRGTTMYK